MILTQLQPIVNNECYRAFQRYQLTYHKQYASIAEKERALYNFCSQLLNLNSKLGNKTYKTKINQILDRGNFFPGFLSIDSDNASVFSDVDLLKSPSAIQARNTTAGIQSNKDYYEMNANTFSGFTDEQLKSYNRANYSAETAAKCAALENQYSFYKLENTSKMYKQLVWTGPRLPNQTDLRKSGLLQQPIDQGLCGSCYAIASMYQWQTLLFRDALMFAQLSGGEWNSSVAATKLSVQYIMNRTYAMNQMCMGGNFVWVAGDFSNARLNTLELERNFPYTSIFQSSDVDTGEPQFPQAKVNYLVNSLYHFGYENSTGCPVTIVQLIPENHSTGGFHGENEQIIKSVLARGLAVIGQMHTLGSDETANQAFKVYSEGVFEGECIIGNISDHQITFVGYGTYKGVPVWIIQNTWGTSWGIQGSFMVRRGANTMCTEWIAYFQLNRFFNISEELDVPWYQNPQYLKHKGLPGSGKLFIDVNAELIRAGLNGLDFEDGTWLSQSVSPAIIVVFILIAGALITILYFLLAWCCCPPKRPREQIFRLKEHKNNIQMKKQDQQDINQVQNQADLIFMQPMLY